MAGNLTNKTEPFKIALTVLSMLFSAIILYIILPLKSDIKDLRQEIKETNQAMIETYKECKDDVAEVRREATQQIINLKDQLFAMLNKLNK